MGEVKHTPGPWSVMLQNSRERRYDSRLRPFWETPVQVGEGASAGNVVCTVFMGGAGATVSTQEAVEANAHLIAAAPELLEAVWALVEHFERVDGDAGHKAVIAKGTAAIARATQSPATEGGE